MLMSAKKKSYLQLPEVGVFVNVYCEKMSFKRVSWYNFTSLENQGTGIFKLLFQLRKSLLTAVKELCLK